MLPQFALFCRVEIKLNVNSCAVSGEAGTKVISCNIAAKALGKSTLRYYYCPPCGQEHPARQPMINAKSTIVKIP